MKSYTFPCTCQRKFENKNSFPPTFENCNILTTLDSVVELQPSFSIRYAGRFDPIFSSFSSLAVSSSGTLFNLFISFLYLYGRLENLKFSVKQDDFNILKLNLPFNFIGLKSLLCSQSQVSQTERWGRWRDR